MRCIDDVTAFEGLRADRKHQWETEHVFDVVRGGLEFGSTQQGCNMLEFVLACDVQEAARSGKSELAGILANLGTAESIEIVRIKNRFFEPTSGGWADTMVNFFFTEDPNEHICEIQLVHTQMMTVRKEQGAHGAYTQTRTAHELLEAIGEETVADGALASGDGPLGANHRASSADSNLNADKRSVGMHGSEGVSSGGDGDSLSGAAASSSSVRRESSGSSAVARQESFSHDIHARDEIATLKAKFALLEETVSVSSGSSYGSFSAGRANRASSYAGGTPAPPILAAMSTDYDDASGSFGPSSFSRAESAPPLSGEEYFSSRRSVSMDSLHLAASDVHWRDLMPTSRMAPPTMRTQSVDSNGSAPPPSIGHSDRVGSDTNPFKSFMASDAVAAGTATATATAAGTATATVTATATATATVADTLPPPTVDAVSRGEFEQLGTLVSSLCGTVAMQQRQIESLVRLVHHLRGDAEEPTLNQGAKLSATPMPEKDDAL